MPTVSVVIPTYNRARVLSKAVGSVLSQTYDDYEIIVVDDASVDDTASVIRKFKDRRITYVRREKNGGEAASRNTGIGLSKGKYIASQDSDDEWLPGKLEKQIRLIESSPREVGVVYTGFWRIEGNAEVYFPNERKGRIQGDIRRELLMGNFVGTPTTVVKKECFEKIGGFDERLRHLVDWEMWIRISGLYQFICVEEPLVISYGMPDAVSANAFALIDAHEYILEKHAGRFVSDKNILAAEQYWIGNLWCQIGNKGRGREYFKKAISVRPLNLKYLGAFLLSFATSERYNRLVALKRKLLDARNSRGKI
jgi:glycosyltransferase involved in cell wall biosynthesis